MVEVPTRMADEEFEAMLQKDGPIAASYEAFSRVMAVWRYENPDDDRGDLDIMQSNEFQAWNQPPESVR